MHSKSFCSSFRSAGVLFAALFTLTGCLKKSPSSYLSTDLQQSSLPDSSLVCAQNQAYSSASACAQNSGVPSNLLSSVSCAPLVVNLPGGNAITCFKLPTQCNFGNPCKMFVNNSINVGTWGGGTRNGAESASNSCLTNSATPQSLAGLLISCQ